jgi:hypothetical protein
MASAAWLLLAALLLLCGACVGQEATPPGDLAKPPWLAAVAARWAENADRARSDVDPTLVQHARSENRTERIGYVKARRGVAAGRRCARAC